MPTSSMASQGGGRKIGSNINRRGLIYVGTCGDCGDNGDAKKNQHNNDAKNYHPHGSLDPVIQIGTLILVIKDAKAT